MSPAVALLTTEEDSFPRVSGDEPTLKDGDEDADLFSPRERG